MDLCFGTAMPHRTEQPRIDSSEPCQRPGIKPIIFSTTLADQSPVTRVGYDPLLPKLGHRRLSQGECVPLSKAIRLRGILLNTSSIPFGVVGSSCSKITSPASFRMQ